MQPNFILVGADEFPETKVTLIRGTNGLVQDIILSNYGPPGRIVQTIKQFHPGGAPPCVRRSLQLKGVYKDDQQAIVGERLRTLGYLRLAEKAWRRQPHPPF